MAKGIAFDQGDKLLCQLCIGLYNNDWDQMVTDLKERLDAKPIIPVLSTRIKADLESIERVREVLARNNITAVDVK